MSARDVFIDRQNGQWRDWWRGQAFSFNQSRGRVWAANLGWKILLLVMAVEGVIRPALFSAAGHFGWIHQDAFLLCEMSGLVVGTLALVLWAGASTDQLGLCPWRRWSAAARIYFIEVTVVTLVIFMWCQWNELKLLWLNTSPEVIALYVFLPQVAWGFYQELIYRGLLQQELVRRRGPATGIFVSNVLFTFGPLHLYHFSLAGGHPSHLWIFAGIFATGLFFGILFERSRILWIVGLLHGLGNFFIDGLGHPLHH